MYRKCEKTTKSIRTEHVRRDNRSRVYKKTAIYCIDEWLNRRVDASLQTALNAPVKMVSFGKSEIPPAIRIYGLIPISMEPCAPDTRKTRRQTPSVKNVILKWWLAVDYWYFIMRCAFFFFTLDFRVTPVTEMKHKTVDIIKFNFFITGTLSKDKWNGSNG